MANHRPLARVLIACALLAACSKKAPEQTNPLAGKVKFNLKTTGTTPATSTAPDICATFTLTPYSLGADGSQTLAGAPVTVTGTGPSSTPILGCVDTPGVSPDWRYVVTATNFAGCTQSVSGIYPAVQTFTVDVDCKPGVDIPATVTANVFIPVANSGGYVDVGVGVNVNTPQSGCKLADIDAGGHLHIGQSYIMTAGGPTPSAYTGIGLYTPPGTTGTDTPAGTLQQFEGSVSSGGQTDAFFTGLLQLPPAPQQATVVQALVQACPGQMTVQPHAVECVTHATLPSTTSTAVQIADTFVEWPGRGSVSATITGAQTISLYTSLGGPHLSTIAPQVGGHDALTHTQALSVAPDTAIGLYGSLVHADELLALVQDATVGPALVVLTLNEGTGQWSAGAPIALSSFSLAQQQAIGLFGQGGCFDMPEVACNPLAGTHQGPTAQPWLITHTNPTPSGTAVASFTHFQSGVPVDGAHPLHESEQVEIALQWSASNLQPGQYAFVAIDVACGNGYAITANPNGGTSFPMGTSPCINGYFQSVTNNGHAFPGIQVPANGGVSENLQIRAQAPAYVDPPARNTWSFPITVYVSAHPAPDGTEVAVYSTTATIPTWEEHREYVATSLVSTQVVNPGDVQFQGGGSNGVRGVVYKLRYFPGESYLNQFASDYLYGTSTVKLLPPAFSDPTITVKQVQGSATTILDGSNIASDLPAATAALGLNSNFSADYSGAIPTFTIDNLINFGANYGPEMTVEWFAPLPTQQNTTITFLGEIDWNGNVFDFSSFTYNVSPIPEAQVQPLIEIGCADENDPHGPNGSACLWMYSWHGAWNFYGERGPTYHNPIGATFLNPDYVTKISPNEHIASTTLGNYSTDEIIYISESNACDNTNIDDTSLWSDIGAGSTRTDWSAVRCVRYQFKGFFFTPGPGFSTALNANIVAGAALNAQTIDTSDFWLSADNIEWIDAANNTWVHNNVVYNTSFAGGNGKATWENTTEFEAYMSGRGEVVPVDTVISTEIGESTPWGLPLPDMTVNIQIDPSATYDTTTTPESWFSALPRDANGIALANTCTQVSATLITCHMVSTTGADIPAPGLWQNNMVVYPRFKFIASQSYNGETASHSMSVGTSAQWVIDAAGLDAQGNQKFPGVGVSGYVTIEGPNQITIDKLVEGNPKDVKPKQTVPFDIVFGALGLDSGALGAGGVAVYDFFGKNFVPGANGAPGTLAAQSQGCAKPVPASVAFLGHSGGTGTNVPAPKFFYTLDTTPDTTAATVWIAVPAGGAIPAAATGLKIVPQSSLGGDGVLLPIDGIETVQVNMTSEADAAGKLCNSAALTATGFNPSSTAEASVPFAPPCDPTPWPSGNTAKQK